VAPSAVRVRHREQQVRRTRPERRHNDARVAPELPVHRRREPGVRFVTHQHEIDAGTPELVQQHEHFTARQSEDALDAGIGQNPRGGCGRGCHERIC
jgi:hypothetical protein